MATSIILFKKKLSDNSGRSLVLDVTINGTEHLLINRYNGNTEPEQLNIFQEFQDLSEKKYHFCREL